MMRKPTTVAGLVGWWVCAAGVSLAGDLPIVEGVPPGYEVIIVDDTPGFYQRPGISNDGQVVYSRSTGAGMGVIYRYMREGGIEALTDGTMNDVWADISPDGTRIVWRRRAPESSGPYHLAWYEDGLIHEFPRFPGVFGIPTVNDADLVAWSHDTSGDGTVVDIYTYDGSSLERVIANGLSNQSTRLNCDGDFAWTRYNFFKSPWVSFTMANIGGDSIELSDGTGQPQGVGINDCDAVVFRQFDGTQDVVRLWQRGLVTTIAPGTRPRINNGGDICFGQWDPDVDFVYPTLLKKGVLYRLPALGYWNTGCGINARGEAAWRGDDQNGGDGILMLRAIQHDGDFDQDCVRTLSDFEQFDHCMAGPSSTVGAGCQPGDFDDDEDVDFADLGAFQQAFGGDEAEIPECVPLAQGDGECACESE